MWKGSKNCNTDHLGVGVTDGGKFLRGGPIKEGGQIKKGEEIQDGGQLKNDGKSIKVIKEYNCDECGMQFNALGALKIHSTIHRFFLFIYFNSN